MTSEHRSPISHICMEKICKLWRLELNSVLHEIKQTKHFPWERNLHSPGKWFYTATYAWKLATVVRGCKQSLTVLMNICQLISVKSFSKSDLHCTYFHNYRAAVKTNKYRMLGKRIQLGFILDSAWSTERDFISTYFACCPQMPPLRGICSNHLSFSNRRPCFLAVWHWQ